MLSYTPTFADVQAAATRLHGLAHKTPVQTCGFFDKLSSLSLFFKCEHLQKVGAFKFRGAMNAILKLDASQAKRGVVTHSSGNHAQALALAARMQGIPAFVVMPSSANPIKKRAVEEYGGRVTDCQPTLAAREETALRIQRETGATLIPPFDHPDVIAGQGTAALELLEEVPDLDVIVAPIGGGGLISGCALAIGGYSPRTRLIAAEPAGADDAARSKNEGRLVPQTAPNSIADGLLTSLGQLTWPFVRDQVSQVIVVSESSIKTTMRLCWERAKLMIEPSSAVAVAAMLPDALKARDGIRRVGIILSGGNVDLDKLPWN